MKIFIATTSFLFLTAFSGLAYSQSGLGSATAATVNGTVISNDAVEQGIQVALSQGQKDSPELRNAVLSKLIEISLLSQQADRDGLANSDKANRQLSQIRQSYLADLELATFSSQNPVTDSDIQAEYNRQVASLGPLPIKMPEGWYLIKLEDKKSSKPPTLEQATPSIRAGLTQKKQFEYLNQLRQGANIVVQ